MASYCDEYDSAVALVISEYQDLQKLNPNHELLNLLKNVNSEGFTKTEKFRKRYDQEGINREIQTLSKCYLEFKGAVTTELFKILRQEKKTTEGELEKRLEEKGLIGMVRTHITHNQIPLERVLALLSS